MKEILVILAHPNKNSLNHHICTIYEKAKLNNSASVEVIDLYKTEYKQDFYHLEKDNTKEREYFQKKILAANEIVFIFPFWWGSIPAILKNWIDCNFTTDFAYKYKNSRPVGLLKGKKVTVFTTTGAPKFYYAITGANRRLKKMLKQQIINFCGMELSNYVVFGGIDTKFKNIKKVEEKVKKIAIL